ncbi:MAG: SUMF1/EgtB/PvdO family nonheme iron enzyme [Candidatus Binatia bacterium]
MKKASATVTAALMIAIGAQAHAATKCPADSVRAGTACMDKYEASVWFVPNATTTNKSLVKKIQQGKVTLADLAKGGASQAGATGDDYGLCSDTGALCTGFFAVSVAGATPSAYVTWFQAVEACGNSQKRLPTNVEWQKAVTNTPDPGSDNGSTDCNTASTSAVVSTGSRSACVSSAGAFDMVGNLGEWVADWVGSTGACPGWGGLSNDAMCLDGGSVVAAGPGVLARGGGFLDLTFAGPLAVEVLPPTGAFVASYVGFRCVR